MSVSVYKLETLAHAPRRSWVHADRTPRGDGHRRHPCRDRDPQLLEYVVRFQPASAAQSFIADVASRQAQFFLDRAPTRPLWPR